MIVRMKRLRPSESPGGSLARRKSREALPRNVDSQLATGLRRIREAGFANSDREAGRFAVLYLAAQLATGAVKRQDPPAIAGPTGPHETSSNEISDALRAVSRGECVCRVVTGRHYVVLELLRALAEHGGGLWLDVLQSAATAAKQFNDTHGLPPSQPPANVLFTPGNMSSRWIRNYLSTGAGRFNERYSRTLPNVWTRARRGRGGTEMELLLPVGDDNYVRRDRGDEWVY